MMLQRILGRILTDARIEQRIREILQEELSRNDDNIVYITRTGGDYHRKDCDQLGKDPNWTGKYPRPVSLSAAIEVGYSRCSFCTPRILKQNTP